MINDVPESPPSSIFFPESQAALDILRERTRLGDCPVPASEIRPMRTRHQTSVVVLGEATRGTSDRAVLVRAAVEILIAVEAIDRTRTRGGDHA